MGSNLNFDSLNDEQKTFLTLITYMDINEEGRKKIDRGESIKVSKLSKYLENPDTPYFGRVGFDSKGFTKFDSLRGKNSPLSVTDEEMVDYMIKLGLGDVKITNIREERGLNCSGFQAYALADSSGNVGISYRGSHFDVTRGALRNWIEANALEYFTGTSTQVKQAQDFFDKNKHLYKKNYVYGASLGGNLAQYVYVKNYDEIAHVFTINGNPINQKELDTSEKVAAFNNPKKATFNIICGDIVGLLKNCDLYPRTVHYIKNNGTLRGLFGLESHLLEAATYDKNHNFVTTTRKEALEMVSHFFRKFTEITRSVRDILNEIEIIFAKTGTNKQEKFNEFSRETFDNLQKLSNEISQELNIKENSINKKSLDE